MKKLFQHLRRNYSSSSFSMTRAAAKAACAAASCPICLDILHEPVASPCGHAFCYDCVMQSLAYSMACPVCRRPIASHRVLRRPETLATLADELSGTSASRVARRVLPMGLGSVTTVLAGGSASAVLGDLWERSMCKHTTTCRRPFGALRATRASGRAP